MRTVTDQDPISVDELRRLAAGRFGDLVKAVVDVEREIMIADADLHADQEAELLASGSSNGICGGSISIRICRRETGSSSTR